MRGGFLFENKKFSQTVGNFCNSCYDFQPVSHNDFNGVGR